MSSRKKSMPSKATSKNPYAAAMVNRKQASPSRSIKPRKGK